MTWSTQGILTDPLTGDILADTGVLPAGVLNVTVMLWCQNGCRVDMEHRNALNTTTLHSARIYVTGDGDPRYVPMPVTLLLNERLRIVMATDAIGPVQGSILS